VKQNAKEHKEEECTSDWRNPEKIRREEEELHTLVTISLRGAAVLLFSDFFLRWLVIHTTSTL
jgi:hypothetical protein